MSGGSRLEERPGVETGTTTRVLVVTAYYKEERALIARTIRSVAGQTAAQRDVTIDHMLVADGFPQDWIDGEAVRHVRLDTAHADYGNTPRGIGTLLGIVEGYDAICYCDADNWFEPNHVEACLALAAKRGGSIDYVVARRTMRRPDETVLPIADEPIEKHVDTNCFFFLPGSYPWLHRFASIPRAMSSVGDRIFYGALKAANLKMAVVPQPTVAYHCLWESIYRAIGERPPEEAKPNVDSAQVDRWLATLTNRELAIVSRLTGLSYARPPGMPEPPSSRPKPPRVLVITAYHEEDRAVLEACMASVAAQTAAAKGLATIGHMLVADGVPQDWIDGTGLRHIKLDRRHGDDGNTPRGIGALLAVSEDWDALCFLDPGNRYRPHHVETCLARAREIGPDCDWLLGQCGYRRPDWSPLPAPADARDIDSNCFFFLRGSFHLLPHFAVQPREIAQAGGEVFHQVLKASALLGGHVGEQTMDCLCLRAPAYEDLGEAPPPGARPAVDRQAIQAWLQAQPPARRRNILRLVGLEGQRAEAAPGGQRDPGRASAPAGTPAPVRSPAGPVRPNVQPPPAGTAAGPARLAAVRSPAGAETPDVRPGLVEAPAGTGARADRPHVRTFGIFDTLVARRCIAQSVVFELVARRIGMPGFPDARRQAEETVAARSRDLDAIYGELARRLHLDAARAQEIQAVELDVELDQIVPIAENLAKVRHGDVLICDTPLDPPVIRRLLDKAGLERNVGLIVTRDGKSSGTIWPRAAGLLQIEEHLGADGHADVAVPSSFNIGSQRTALSEPTAVEEALMSLGLRPLAELCREVRLATWSPDERARRLQLVAASLNFPILLLASVALLRLGERLKKRSVLFSSGECNMWRPLFDEMARRSGMMRASTCFYTSRSLRTAPSPSYLSYARRLIDDDSIVVDLCGSGASLAGLAEKLDRQDLPVFLVHQLRPAATEERVPAQACAVHGIVPPDAADLDPTMLEMCNHADHAMIVDVLLIQDSAVPVFAADPRDASTLALARAQQDCFRTALKRLGNFDWRDIFDLDDAFIGTVCTALYQVLSRQSVLKEGYGGKAAGEENEALQRTGRVSH